MNHLPTLQAPVHRKPLLLYLASHSQAIRALLAQEDDKGNEQPIYYVSREGYRNQVSRDRESMFGGNLCILKAKMILFSSLDSPSNKVSPYKSPPPSTLADWKGSPVASTALLIRHRHKDP